MSEEVRSPQDELSDELSEIAEIYDNYLKAFSESDTELDVRQMEKLQFCESVMRKITHGDNVEIHTETSPDFPDGSVIIRGNNLRFTNPEWFSRAAQFSDEFEVEALADNAVRMEFVFRDVYKETEA